MYDLVQELQLIGHFLVHVSPGIPVVVGVAISAWLMAALFALILEALRRIPVFPIPQAVNATIFAVRGVPDIVMLFIIFYGLTGVIRLSAFASAILALAIVQAPFMAEIYRAALLTVPETHRWAAISLGLEPYKIARYVIFPQALRFALAPMGNTLLGLTKMAAITSAVGIPEVTKLGLNAMEDNATYVLPVTLAICLAYLMLTLPMSMAVGLLAKYSRGRRLQG